MNFVPKYGQKTWSQYMENIFMDDVLAAANYQLDKSKSGKQFLVYRSGSTKIVTYHNTGWMDPSEGGHKYKNAVNFITEHRNEFPEGLDTSKSDAQVVNAVFARLANEPKVSRTDRVDGYYNNAEPFVLSNYRLKAKVDLDDPKSIRPFFRYFGGRRIDPMTQRAFADFYAEMSHESKPKDGKKITFTNICFPYKKPGSEETVGFEMRTATNPDGKAKKYFAVGSDKAHGLWIANLGKQPLNMVDKVLWFESTYDAMAYYQLHHKDDKTLDKAVFVSTGGQPGAYQELNMMRATPQATHVLCFDNDLAGKGFASGFKDLAEKENRLSRASISRDMRPYIQACQYTNGTDILPTSGKNGNIDLLPQDMQEKYNHLMGTQSKLDRMKFSGMASDEEINEAETALETEKVQFQKDFIKRSAIGDLSYDIKTVRELPSEGFKDWNDEVIASYEQDRDEQEEDKRKVGSHTVDHDLGYDADGDGVDEVEEEQEPIPEEKKHNVRHS